MSVDRARTIGLGGVVAAVAAALVLIGGCPPVEPPPDNTVGDSGLTGKFVGSTRCGDCHGTTQTGWLGTLHAGALETLEEMGQGANAACLPCHTVGFGEAGGFVDRATTNSLAGVGCEACHGAARDHVNQIEDPAKWPVLALQSSACGRCHTTSHHPHLEEWAQSGHAAVTEGPAEEFAAGEALTRCGPCHSGDYYHRAYLYRFKDLLPPDDDDLAGVAPADQTPVTCAICHEPHARTGNAAAPDAGRDFQLRHPEVATPTPTNTEAAVVDATRFNQCGQCHHSRGRTWQSTSRGPHHSVQSNVYVGEMPIPAGTDLLVFSRVSVHSFAPEQCATCHMFRQDFQSELAPAISGHTFAINTRSCGLSGCHPSRAQAEAALATLQTEIQGRLDEIAALLGDPATWEYSAEGGPADQDSISDAVKQARFLYHYALSDGSLGMHNPAYVRDMLVKAKALLLAEQAGG